MMENIPYRELIGSLLYISRRTRRDISFTVSILCLVDQASNIKHWNAAKRVLRYLSGTKGYEIEIGRTGENDDSHINDQLVAYCDDNWAGDRRNRASTRGFILFLNGGIISRSTRKQNCIALSSTEAEYVPLLDCVRNVACIRRILEELGSACTVSPTILYEDNQSCIS